MARYQPLRMRYWTLVLCTVLASLTSTRACDECNLQDALNIILSQSSETASDHHSHMHSLDDRSNLARAVQKALNSLKGISETVDFSTLAYRRFDGLGNNLANPFWGSSLHTERRLLNNSYDDGRSE
ncbi:hypothetical protein RRG08_031932 [Elysia crispata]|uniref:Uncharacterized protein n=1 Tax=Elysia crispata TaxID=231223 RepID=A0AAE1AHF3_9GAST|nr:hypothetical protein RRG08_031932 [Elysia crispata]